MAPDFDDLDWDPRVKEIFDKVEKPPDEGAENFIPTSEDWELISSPEFAFYQGVQSFDKLNSDREARQVNASQWFNHIGTESTGIEDWMCELTQNALDQEAKFCRFVINNEKGTLEFSHDGVGIQGPKYGNIIGDIKALMRMGISMKVTDMKSEGRFGVGFKYWMRHYEYARVTFDRFSISWSSTYTLKDCEVSGNGESNLTSFLFSEKKDDGQIVDFGQLDRLKQAIRLRPHNLKISVEIDGETQDWKHSLVDKKEIRDENLDHNLILLSFIDSFSDDDNRETTLVEFPMKSPVFSTELQSSLREEMIDWLFGVYQERFRQGLEEDQPPSREDAEERIDSYMLASTLVLGYFHGTGDDGSLVSMFPISDMGTSTSRISFSGPFSLTPDRLNLTNSARRGATRNRTLVKMMMICYGYFLKSIQENKSLENELVRHLLENPPGQHKSTSELDELIQLYCLEKLEFPYFTKKASPEDSPFRSWPTIGEGLQKIGHGARQLDPLLVDYRNELLQGDSQENREDLDWLQGSLDPNTIAFDSSPIVNWITESQSENKQDPFTGVRIIIEEEE